MVYLDTNILIEISFPDRLRREAVSKLLQQTKDSTAISILTAHLMYYFGRKYRVPDEVIAATIEPHALLPLTLEDYRWARQHEAGKDFEDALQVSSALRAGCATFITLDKPLIKRYAKNYPQLSFIAP